MLAASVAAGLAGTANAERATVLGKSRSNPEPACSEKDGDECQITGQVTGFQRAIRGVPNVFKAPRHGRIVAWSVHLGRPSKEERNAFGEAAETGKYGESPTAGISILRKKRDGSFELMRASRILEVQSYYGQKPIFTLDPPLRIRKGQIVALTTATWLPAFAFAGQRPNDVWVASRRKKNCDPPDSVPREERLDYFFAHTSAHKRVGSSRRYECVYDSARLLYWAYFDPR